MTPAGTEAPSPIDERADERADEPLAVVVLISGRGSNLQAIIDNAGKTSPAAPFRVRAVISNEPGAAGLRRATAANIDTAVVDHRDFPSRQAFDEALAAAVDGFSAQLIVLAGFMRILGPSFVGRYRGRLINIHPSLLPAFPGLDTHARAIRAREQAIKEESDPKKTEALAFHGATVHFVGDDLDAGPIIARARVPILDGDDPSRLAERVLEREHHLLPLVIRWFAAGRLRIAGSQVLLDDRPALTHHEAPI